MTERLGTRLEIDFLNTFSDAEGGKWKFAPNKITRSRLIVVLDRRSWAWERSVQTCIQERPNW
jgi:hypothetical protein